MAILALTTTILTIALPLSSSADCDKAVVELDLPSDYDSTVPSERPFDANFTFYVRGIQNVDDSNAEITMTMLTRIDWRDTRIVESNKGNCSKIVGPESTERIWKPGIYLLNSGHYRVLKFGKDVADGIFIEPGYSVQ